MASISTIMREVTIGWVVLASAFQITIAQNPVEVQAESTPDGGGVSMEEFKKMVLNMDGSSKMDVHSFLQTSQEENVVVLDVRPASSFNQMHLEGAINLPMSDFSEIKLHKLVPDPSSKIVLYGLNNNQNPSPSLSIPLSGKRDIQTENDSESTQSGAPLPISPAEAVLTELYNSGYQNVSSLKELSNAEIKQIKQEDKKEDQ